MNDEAGSSSAVPDAPPRDSSEVDASASAAAAQTSTDRVGDEAPSFYFSRKPRLQDLLKQRFHLVAHEEIRKSRGYALVVAKGGPHLVPTKAAHFPGYRINASPGQMRGENWTSAVLAKYLTSAAGFPVVDETHLTGSYDVSFRYAANAETNSDQLPLEAALKEATGIQLLEHQYQHGEGVHTAAAR